MVLELKELDIQILILKHKDLVKLYNRQDIYL